MTKTAIIFNILDKSCMTYHIDKLVQDPSNDQFYIFYKNIHSTTVPTFMSHICNLPGFHGNIVVFDIDTLLTVRSLCLGKVDIYLYLYDIDWLYKQMNYIELRNILKDMKIYCRSNNHKKIIDNLMDDNVAIVEESLEEWLKSMKN